MVTIEKLVKFIKAHGHEVAVSECGQYLIALDVWTYDDENGDQQVGQKYTRIEPTAAAVREWLGY